MHHAVGTVKDHIPAMQIGYAAKQSQCPLPAIINARAQRNGGENMSTAERRLKIVERLCIIRHDTYHNLAHEFGVSRETIRRDILVLMCSYPIETVRGRYGGGVKISDDYWPYRNALDSDQIDFLIRHSKKVEGSVILLCGRFVTQ